MIDDPKIQSAVFGAALPLVAAAVAAGVPWLLARRSRRASGEAGAPRELPSWVGFGPALGLGLAFAVASLGIVGVPDNRPRSMSEWMLPIVGAGAVVAAVPMLIRPRVVRELAIWIGRAAFLAGLLVWPLANTRQNHWDGTESILWQAGIGLWMLAAFAGMDRVAARVAPVPAAVVLGLGVAGLIPVIFGAGVTSHPQVSGGLAAGVFGLGLIVLLSKGTIPLRAAAGVFVPWLTASLLVSWQFVAEMAWWEFGTIASIPLALAGIMLLPKLRRLSPAKLGWVLVAATIALTAAVSASHAPGMIDELTGSGSSGDPLEDYYNSL